MSWNYSFVEIACVNIVSKEGLMFLSELLIKNWMIFFRGQKEVYIFAQTFEFVSTPNLGGADLGTKSVASLRRDYKLACSISHVSPSSRSYQFSLYYLMHVPHPFLDSCQIILSTYKCHSRIIFYNSTVFSKVILFSSQNIAIIFFDNFFF